MPSPAAPMPLSRPPDARSAGAATGIHALRDRHPAARLMSRSLLPQVAAFRRLQDTDGRIPAGGGPTRAAAAWGDGAARDPAARLRGIAADVTELAGLLGTPELGPAFAADTEDWLAVGLRTPPRFDRTAAAYQVPDGDGHSFFCGPMTTANGPAPRGWFLECFWAYRQEPSAVQKLARRYPHPGSTCQSTRLLAASDGLATGNCIVFFPENVATAEPVRRQSYAVFFFNKFERIFAHLTLPAAARLLGASDAFTGAAAWQAGRLSTRQCYDARCVWGYLHDYFHHVGPRPFHENMRIKLTWFCGVLEEIKVDAQTIRLCQSDGAIPYRQEVLEFALLERLLRYPQQGDACVNFDAATGVLLYEWLRDREALVPHGDGTLRLDPEGVTAGLDALVETIEGFERDPDDASYKAAAKAFVRRFLPEGRPGDRFSLPDRFAAEVGLTPSADALDCRSMTY